MIIKENYFPADHSVDVNQKFEYLENRRLMLTEEISKTSNWKISKIVSLRRRIRKADQDRNDFMCNNGLIYHACILEL